MLYQLQLLFKIKLHSRKNIRWTKNWWAKEAIMGYLRYSNMLYWEDMLTIESRYVVSGRNSKCVPAVRATQLTCSADCVCGFHVTWTGCSMTTMTVMPHDAAWRWCWVPVCGEMCCATRNQSVTFVTFRYVTTDDQLCCDTCRLGCVPGNAGVVACMIAAHPRYG